MKYRRFFFKIFAAAALLYSCNKNKFNEPQLGELDITALENKHGVEGLLIGAYSMLDGTSGIQFNYGAAASNWIYGSICGSEAYKGGPDESGDQPDISAIEEFKPNAYNSDLAQKWAAVYDGVARTNEVLRVMRKAKDMSATDTTEVRAEALFLRAHYHFEAKKIWNNIPYVDEAITVGASNYHVANDTSWLPLENDLIYAMNNLPATQSAPGRANKYAAKALLAKAYLFQKKYVQAQPLLQDLIDNGKNSSGVKYVLDLLFHDNFDPAKKNGTESIFAAQMSVNDGASPQNGNFGDLLNYPVSITGGYGFFQPSQYLVNHFKTDPVSGLPDLDNYNTADVKNDEGFASGDPFIPYAGTLDPRLDWTVGRRGIPYLDWGIHTGYEWIRYQPFGGPYSAKKNVISKNEFATYGDAGWGGPRFNANNVNLIRFADVLLWTAEVEVEIGSLDKAEVYVNMIRNRMADHHQGWVHKYLNDSNPAGGSYTDDAHLAANYKIKPYPPGDFTSHGKDYARRAVQYERMLELGMEGHRFFDLVRWRIADQEINGYLHKEQNLRKYLNVAVFIKGKNEYFPIPQTQIDLSAGADGIPRMKQNPGY